MRPQLPHRHQKEFPEREPTSRGAILSGLVAAEAGMDSLGFRTNLQT